MILEASSHQIPEMNEVILAAKRHWGYPEEMITAWLPDLLVDEGVLASRRFWTLEDEGRIAGVFSISVNKELCCELEDFWVLPQFMGQGAGRMMFGFVQDWLQTRQLSELMIVADPNAKGFYERMGAVMVGSQPSVPEGRQLPVMRYALEPTPTREF
ncbi:N-acetyltransferase [Pseudovibrio japonicus]|uniref:N-acetyltransferase n=1 Tax=Pseudovibrio japonicus TaxID=366534 RepID=A0ABQ3EGS5_9HYPH|nr:GNAT family N-acetyltransferase [Pseudovibrio japonicus]GHB36290.1 N-acetyltransferase [Pseudovibrio japonicus]